MRFLVIGNNLRATLRVVEHSYNHLSIYNRFHSAVAFDQHDTMFGNER